MEKSDGFAVPVPEIAINRYPDFVGNSKTIWRFGQTGYFGGKFCRAAREEGQEVDA